MKHLKTLENIRPFLPQVVPVTVSYVKSMVSGGDLCLLNNVFPGFHISGVCSDIRSFNRILRRIWMLFTRFDRCYWFCGKFDYFLHSISQPEPISPIRSLCKLRRAPINYARPSLPIESKQRGTFNLLWRRGKIGKKVSKIRVSDGFYKANAEMVAAALCFVDLI